MRDQIKATQGEKKIPEFDGVYILTTDNRLIEVIEAQPSNFAIENAQNNKTRIVKNPGLLRAFNTDNDTDKSDKLNFSTDKFYKISQDKFKALVIKGEDILNGLMFRPARRAYKLFSFTEFEDRFNYELNRYFPLASMRKKALDKDVHYFEPTDIRNFGNAKEGYYLVLVNEKDKNIKRFWLVGIVW